MTRRVSGRTTRLQKCSYSVGEILCVSISAVAFVNIMLLVYATPNFNLDEQVVRGVRVKQDGSIVLNVAGLLSPARGPTKDFMGEPIVHNEVNFVINPSTFCLGKQTQLLVAVSSNAINIERRKLTRQYIKKDKRATNGTRLIFFVSMYPHIKGFQRRILRESYTYGDIVQINAVEHYRNLTIKSIAMLHWVTRYCPEARFVLKQDDDVTLPIHDVIRALLERSMGFDHFIVGNSKLLVESPIRNEVSKYFVRPEEYADSFYPTFAHGPGYAFPIKTGALLYQACLRTPFFWLEDVFVTGLCAAKAGVPIFFDSRLVLNEDFANRF